MDRFVHFLEILVVYFLTKINSYMRMNWFNILIYPLYDSLYNVIGNVVVFLNCYIKKK